MCLPEEQHRADAVAGRPNHPEQIADVSLADRVLHIQVGFRLDVPDWNVPSAEDAQNRTNSVTLYRMDTKKETGWESPVAFCLKEPLRWNWELVKRYIDAEIYT